MKHDRARHWRYRQSDGQSWRRADLNVATEVRQAMDSGVVNSVAFAPHAHMAYGTIENATWWTTNLNPGT